MELLERIRLQQLRQQYKDTGYLGRGEFGSVRIFQDREDGSEYALKMVRCDSAQHRDEALLEIQILSRLQHPRVIKPFKYYHETFHTRTKGVEYEVGVLLERGLYSLDTAIKSSPCPYTVGEVRRFLVNFIELGAHLQGHQLVHRDIKPSNIILFGNGLDFKLADFGLSCYSYKRPRGYAGTLHYSSPALNSFKRNGDRYKVPLTNPYKDDVYSLGVTGKEMYQRLPKGSLQVEGLIDQMLTHDERQRPTFIDLMRHQLVRAELGRASESPPSCHRSASCRTPQRLEIQPNQYPTIRAFDDSPDYEASVRTISPKNGPPKNISFIELEGMAIRTLCCIGQGLVVVGTSSGQIAMVDVHESRLVHLSYSHGGYVAQIALDEDKGLWTAGGNGQIAYIELDKLMECWRSGRYVKRELVRKVFGGQMEKVTESMVIPAQMMEMFPIELKGCNISTIKPQDRSNYAVGCCRGEICGQWRGKPFAYHVHDQTITSLTFVGHLLYSADFAGNVKVYDLSCKAVSKNTYYLPSMLMSLQHTSHERGFKLEGISCEGQLDTVNTYGGSCYDFHSHIPWNNLIAAVYFRQEWITLTTEGEVIRQKEVWADGKEGEWCCMDVGGGQLVTGSQNGDLMVVDFQL